MLAQANAFHVPLADESVHCVITSPPYWGLRFYSTSPQVFGGEDGCEHEWGGLGAGHHPGQVEQTKWKTVEASGKGQNASSGQLCARCGAWRGELGMESTSELYVAHIVEAFREVRRVLREDGVCFLNLGDSYAASMKGSMKGQDKSGLTSTRSQEQSPAGIDKLTQSGLKPKDLCMIPARVVIALQQPYYVGGIEREADRRWLAAMTDAEGCLYVSRSKAGSRTGRERKYVRTQDAFDAGVKITNTNRRIVDEVAHLVGYGSVRVSRTRDQNAWEWAAYSGNARKFVREIYPYLIGKQQEARIVFGCPPSGDRAFAAHEALKGLHHGKSSDVDFSAPPSLYKPGWWLRSAAPWIKRSSMPESVMDRPSSSLEYIFLLAKSQHYFFDMEAVKRGVKLSSVARLNRAVGNNHKNSEGAPGQTPHTLSQSRPNKRLNKATNPSAFGGGDHLLAPFDPTSGRNWRNGDVWFDSMGMVLMDDEIVGFDVPSQPYSGKHFATFPESLVEPMILSATSTHGCCPDCSAPWERVVGRQSVATRPGKNGKGSEGRKTDRPGQRGNPDARERRMPVITQMGWRPTCDHYDALYPQCFPQARSIRKRHQRDVTGDWWKRVRRRPVNMGWNVSPAIVLDPFCGSGTVGAVARLGGRSFVGLDINPTYLRDHALVRAEKTNSVRSMAELPLFAWLAENAKVE